MKSLKWTFLLTFFLSGLAYADYGCHFVLNSRLETPLNAAGKKIAIRFTSRQDMSLIGVSFYCEQAVIPPAYQVELREDIKGMPSTAILESASVTPKGGCWNTVPFNNLPLFPGKVYHIVIEQDATRGGQHLVGIIDSQHFASIAYGDHLNPFDPTDEKPDPRLNVLTFDGETWQTLDRQPLYALHGAGSKYQGNPYDSFEELPIHGNGTSQDRSDDVLRGEALHPHSGLSAKGFAVRLRKQGQPTAPLNYRVYVINFLQHKTTLAFTGQALQPDQVTDSFQWVTIGIHKEDHAQSFPPECRYVVFQSDSGRPVSQSPGCEDCYVLSEVGNSGGLGEAADMTFDSGAHRSRETFSIDGGATWIDRFERDANVVIIGDLGATGESPELGDIPTPEPWYRDWTP
jgi:hypothetical protein